MVANENPHDLILVRRISGGRPTRVVTRTTCPHMEIFHADTSGLEVSPPCRAPKTLQGAPPPCRDALAHHRISCQRLVPVAPLRSGLHQLLQQQALEQRWSALQQLRSAPPLQPRLQLRWAQRRPTLPQGLQLRWAQTAGFIACCAT